MSLGRLLLNASAFLLFQGLIRDLWILTRNRSSKINREQNKASCICLESTVGMIGILTGALLLGIGVNQSLILPGWGLTIMFAFILSVGFLIKNTVLQWNPWRIYQDKDHMNIVFVWKH